MTKRKSEIVLGPVLFNWPNEVLEDFYNRIADEADVDVVYVGEAVCSKRTPFRQEVFPRIVERLEGAGKKVILSTLALVTTKIERKALAETCADDSFLIEANDLTALSHLSGRPHAIGPYVNIYNEGTLAYLERQGAQRICLPPELAAHSVEILSRAAKATIEVFAFGRLPLALSARCYHARVHKLTKDSCRFICEEDADGMQVDSLNGKAFLSVNGIQTLSHNAVSLLGDAPDLVECGVSAFRLSPHSVDMVKVAGMFRSVLDGKSNPDEATEELAGLCPDLPLSNGFIHGVEGMRQVAAGLMAEGEHLPA
jgi:collagenase-like PrtC family protease